MPEELATQEPKANAVAPAESAPAVVEPKPIAAPPAATPGSAPVVEPKPSSDPPPTPVRQESEPVGDPNAVQEPEIVEEPKKVVQQLKHTRKRAQVAEQENVHLRGQLEEARKNQGIAPPPVSKEVPPTDTVPSIDDYANYDDFIKASVKYDIKLEEKQRRKAVEEEDQRTKRVQIDHKFSTRVNKVMLDKLPDYQEVMQSTQIDLDTLVLEAIKESEVGPEIAYHLAKNPDVSEKIAQMSASSAIREIGRLEVKFTEAPPPAQKINQVTQAPEPIKPATTQVSPTKRDYNTMPVDEYMRTRNSETFARVGNRMQHKK